MLKFLPYPILSAYVFNNLTANEWNVDIAKLCESEPTNCSALSFISLAALFVNVNANIFNGDIPISLIICAILYVTVRVLPLPAPAKISTGPSIFSAAFLCSTLSSSKIDICNYPHFLYTCYL